MQAVLLLNADCTPLQVISWRRAYSLLMREKVVCDLPAREQEVNSVSHAWCIPNVLRLKVYINAPHRTAWTRIGVMQRDKWTCIYCGVQAGKTINGRYYSKDNFSLEHIRPRSRGGKDTWANTACACNDCNHRKGDKLPHEAGMTLRWEPKRPRGRVIVASSNIPIEWKQYLQI